MISAEKAIETAKHYARIMIKDRKLDNMLVEEIEKSRNGQNWIITLGWDGRRKTLTPVEMAMGISDVVDREYKIFHIDGKTGAFKKMKLRE
ncbi:MAG: hypothetical protein K8E24_006460 [Methanobacterium paludis]|nr:hypothetical protein [Methanobacterium paludis]